MTNDEAAGGFLVEFLSGPGDGEIVTLETAEAVIGQGDDGVGVRLPHDKLVSARHARLRMRDGRISIEDLASAEGTFVNNEKLQSECVLDADDIVRVGHTEFTCRPPHVKPVSADAIAADRFQQS